MIEIDAISSIYLRKERTIYRKLLDGDKFSGSKIAKKRAAYRELLFALDPTCAYCGKGIQWIKTTLDHIVPLSKGGEDCQSNTVLCCAPCNASKNNRTLDEWIDDLEATRKWLKQNPTTKDKIRRFLALE